MYTAGMLLSQIAARQKHHILVTAGIGKAEARLKLTHLAPAAAQYCGVQLSRLPSHHQTQGFLECRVCALAHGWLVSWPLLWLALQRMLELTLCCWKKMSAAST